MAEYHMNPSYGEHMKAGGFGKGEDGMAHKPKGHGGKGKHTHIHIHSHEQGHTVHIMHPDGTHEKHEHEPGDAEGMAQHIHDQYGDGGGMNEPISEEPTPEPEETV